MAVFIVIAGISLDFGVKVWAQKTLQNEHFIQNQAHFPACTDIHAEARRSWFTENNATPIVLIPKMLQLRYTENCGSSFRLLDRISEGIRFPFLIFIGILACVAIPLIYLRVPQTQQYLRLSLPLILSGAVGNLIDRIHYRYVVDFIDCFVVFRGKAYHWPTFNIADALILTGLGLMVLHLYRESTATPKTADALPPETQSSAPDSAPKPVNKDLLK